MIEIHDRWLTALGVEEDIIVYRIREEDVCVSVTSTYNIYISFYAGNVIVRDIGGNQFYLR